jgi:gallate dioxygenase
MGIRSGFNNVSWDEQFLDLIEADPEILAEMTHADYARIGGVEGAEIIMWLVMRGALPAKVKRVHRAYHLPSMTGIASLVLEPETSAVDANLLSSYRAKVAHQLAGEDK